MTKHPNQVSGKIASRIKIFGERNSGTNYLEQLLHSNTDASIVPGNDIKLLRWAYKITKHILPNSAADRFVENHRDKRANSQFAHFCGWKHAQVPYFPPSIDRYPPGLGFVSLTKNPYAWLLSLHRRPYQNPALTHAKISFADFLRQPWPTVGREGRLEPYPNPIQMWNAKTASYFSLAQYGPHLHICYETLLTRPEETIDDIINCLGLTARSAPFLEVTRSTKPEAKTREDYAKRYTAETWRKALTSDDIAFVNTQLDPEVVERVGYSMINPDDAGQTHNEPHEVSHAAP